MKSNLLVAMILLFSVYGIETEAQSKDIKISGKVISFEESFPLDGVSIHVKGNDFYTGTQADGTFSIAVSTEARTLVFELKEYETQEVAISTANEYDVVLKRNSSTISAAQYNFWNEDFQKLFCAEVEARYYQ